MGLPVDSTLDFDELAATPGAPAAGITRLYSKTTGGLFVQSSALAETQLMPISQRGPATWFTTETGVPVSPSTSTSPLYGDPVYVSDYVVRKSDMEVFLVGGTQSALTLTDQGYTLGIGAGPNAIVNTITRAYASSSQSYAAGWNLVALSAVDFDPGSCFNTTTHVYTAPIAGYYRVSAGLQVSVTAGNDMTGGVWKNATVSGVGFEFGDYVPGATESVASFNGSTTLLLNAGDTLGLYLYGNDAQNEVGGGSDYSNFLNVNLIAPLTSAPVQPNTGARMYLAGSFSIPAAAFTVIPFDTIAAGNDPGSHMTTGAAAKYTASSPGLYEIEAYALAGLNNSPQRFIGSIYVNGAEAARVYDDTIRNGTGGDVYLVGGTAKLRLNTGDYVQFALYNNGGNSTALDAGATLTYISVVKVDQPAAAPANTGWFTPTLGSGSTTNVTPQYMKDANGFVHLRGSVVLAATSENMFTLPAGFRPGITDYYGGVLTTGGAAGVFLNISTAGIVNGQVPAAGNVIYLNGVTFLAEN